MIKILSMSIVIGLTLFVSATLVYGQRGRGGSVGGVGAARGTGVGTMRGTGIGTVGGVDRRTAVIAGAINNGNLGNGVRDGWGGGRPGIGGGVAYPGLAAGASSSVRSSDWACAWSFRTRGVSGVARRTASGARGAAARVISGSSSRSGWPKSGSSAVATARRWGCRAGTGSGSSSVGSGRTFSSSGATSFIEIAG